MPEPKNQIEHPPTTDNNLESKELEHQLNLIIREERNNGFNWSMADVARLRQILGEVHKDYKKSMAARTDGRTSFIEAGEALIRFFLENYGVDLRQYLDADKKTWRFIMEKCNRMREERQKI